MLYSTGSTHLLSAIITRATGMDTKTYAERALTAPLGYSMSYWSQDPQGIYFGGNDMEMTPRQMLRFGELYLNNGRYDGEQILAPQWIQVSHELPLRAHRAGRDATTVTAGGCAIWRICRSRPPGATAVS